MSYLVCRRTQIHRHTHVRVITIPAAPSYRGTGEQAVWQPGSADTVCPRPFLTLTFDRLTLKLVCASRLRWGTFLPNLRTLGLWVLKLFAMYATDGQTAKDSKLTVFVVHWKRVFLISTRHIERIRGVFATMRYINLHLHLHYRQTDGQMDGQKQDLLPPSLRAGA